MGYVVSRDIGLTRLTDSTRFGLVTEDEIEGLARRKKPRDPG